MVVLIASLGANKDSWKKINILSTIYEWEKIYYLCDEFSYHNYNLNDKHKETKIKLMVLDVEKTTTILSEFFKNHIKDLEIALNLESGEGIGHMLILSSILKSGLGIRLVYINENNSLKEINIYPKQDSFNSEFYF